MAGKESLIRWPIEVAFDLEVFGPEAMQNLCCHIVRRSFCLYPLLVL